MISFLVTSLFFLAATITVQAEAITDQLTIQHTGLSHVPISKFIQGNSLTDETFDGPQRVFCTFAVDENFEYALTVNMLLGRKSEDFRLDAIIARLLRGETPVLTINAYRQIMSENGDVWTLDYENMRYVYGYLAGAVNVSQCEE